MNRACAKSFTLAVEAGTGVGKSMAYLVPLALTARANNITVGVATKTNALLDQLVFHELPALSSAFEEAGEAPLRYAALKGITHYPCLRKIDNLANRDVREMETASGEKQTSAAGVAQLLTFVTQSGYDDADTLRFDSRLIPRYDFTSDSSDCLKRKCPYFGAGCFGHGARRAAETADVVVTNHALLFADLEADGALLPPIRYWVVDEAHGAEEEARNAFSIELRSEDVLRLAARAAAEDAQHNLFRRVARRDERFAAQVDKVLAAAEPFAAAAQEYTHEVKRLCTYCQNSRSTRANYGEALWLSESVRGEEPFTLAAAAGQRMKALSAPVIDQATELLAALAAADAPADMQNEVGAFCFDMRELIAAADVVFGETDPTYVYSAYVYRKQDKFAERLCAQVIDVGEHLNNTLFRRTNAVVFTSATLTVGGSFEAFNRAVGLGETEFSESRTLRLDSSFDFDRNMTIYIPTDMPEYNNKDNSSYIHHLERLLTGAHLASHGGLLTLFASRADMDVCYEVVQPALDEAGLVLERQRQGVSTKNLCDTFVSNRDSSLFALKSFWAGFDAPGDTLRGVIIPRLPFVPPTDPLSRVREERDSNAWMHYSLTQAVIETRQAVGRLIRKADDRGIVILADSRVLTKGYGRIVLSSMPSQNIKRMRIDEIIDDIARFFAEE